MTKEEAIEKVLEMKLSPGKDAELIIALHTLIPELAESEDERIRKELIGMVKFHCADEHLDRYLTWLEKQKEQKPFNVCEQCPYYKDCPDYNEKKQEWSEEEKPIPQEEFDAAKHESLWGEQKPAGWKQGKRIEVGNKVKIHCREDRNKDMLSIYNDKVGEVISIWDAQRNPWGPIIVRLDNGCNNGFHEDELDIFDEPPTLEKHC